MIINDLNHENDVPAQIHIWLFLSELRKDVLIKKKRCFILQKRCEGFS